MELTEELIKRRSQHFDLACVQRLNLAKAGVAKVAALAECTALVELNLSHNKIANVGGIPPLPALRSLDLSHNALASLEALPALPELEELRLEGNDLTDVNWAAIAKKLPQLRRLVLRTAATASRNRGASSFGDAAKTRSLVCDQVGYGDVVPKALQSLEFLDGEALALRHVGRAQTSATDAPELLAVEKEMQAVAWGPLDWTLEARDPAFVAKCTKPLRALLQECESELFGESQDLLEHMQQLVRT
ncbi:hypothetical protein ACHHYP_09861 [Achlya hypogyna]|uniref:Uncharacterized protein n=1 Tax=Achlya hypogyna TaxID=1202772 RepID=A0A1V9ZIP8_ACHHY|nr:hypothetical protein ACHHYP_09861 [Achlya hypogyna]